MYSKKHNKQIKKNNVQIIRQNKEMSNSDRKWARFADKKKGKTKVTKLTFITEQPPISIIIPAYDVVKYIEPCLDSIYNQNFFKTYNNAEVLICVDNCIPTLNKIQTIMAKYKGLDIKLFSTETNVGPYLIRNTLIGKTKYENILFFDSDDILVEDGLSKMFKNFTNDILRFSFNTFKDNDNHLSKNIFNPKFATGIFLIKKSVFNVLGGFLPWKCAADGEFRLRCERNFITKLIKEPLFYRRLRNNSLTFDKKTGMKSELRLNYSKKISYDSNFLFVEREITPIKEIKNLNILLAGPWVGEFGWELFCWHGYIRKLSLSYDKTIIIGRPTNEFLYSDFADEYIPFNPKSFETDAWKCDKAQNSTSIIKGIPHTNYISGIFDIGMRYSIKGVLDTKGLFFKEQIFKKLTSNTVISDKFNSDGYDVIFHCRNKNVGSDRNWLYGQWNELKKILGDDLTIGCIGNLEAFHIPDTDDLRGINLDELVSIMNKSKIIVGPSSGPMHLASLTGLKHLVWSTEYNRIRYEKDWNPLKTEVIFYSDENWDPNPKIIKKLIIENL